MKAPLKVQIDSRHSWRMIFARQNAKLLDQARFPWGQTTPEVTPEPTPQPTPQPVPMSTPKPRPNSITKRSKRRLVRLYASPPTVEEHALHLLRWIQDDFWSCDVLARDLQRIYPEVCETMGLAPRPWNSVARELRRLTGGRKDYAWVEGERLRVYRIPRLRG
jgi:hypothetical protein